MRYRALSPTGDYTIGASQANFLVNVPATVGQAILTRLRLWVGEWFLDVTEGMPYQNRVLGAGTRQLYDRAVQARILGTPGVLGLIGYTSTLDGATRTLTISASVQTIYGVLTLALPVGPAIDSGTLIITPDSIIVTTPDGIEIVAA